VSKRIFIRQLESSMVVSGTAAYGMYSSHVPLPDIVGSLNRGGFNNEDICMVVSPAHPIANVVRDAKIVDGTSDDSAANARTIQWFTELGAVVIPTVGLFIRSQVYFRALLIEQDFSTLSRDSRTLAGLGFPEREAERLAPLVSGIGAMVYVSCAERSQADSAVELLRRTGASEAARIPCAKAAEAVA
jgi:hypothetical protein